MKKIVLTLLVIIGVCFAFQSCKCSKKNSETENITSVVEAEEEAPAIVKPQASKIKPPTFEEVTKMTYNKVKQTIREQSNEHFDYEMLSYSVNYHDSENVLLFAGDAVRLGTVKDSQKTREKEVVIHIIFSNESFKEFKVNVIDW